MGREHRFVNIVNTPEGNYFLAGTSINKRFYVNAFPINGIESLEGNVEYKDSHRTQSFMNLLEHVLQIDENYTLLHYGEKKLLTDVIRLDQMQELRSALSHDAATKLNGNPKQITRKTDAGIRLTGLLSSVHYAAANVLFQHTKGSRNENKRPLYSGLLGTGKFLPLRSKVETESGKSKLLLANGVGSTKNYAFTPFQIRQYSIENLVPETLKWWHLYDVYRVEMPVLNSNYGIGPERFDLAFEGTQYQDLSGKVVVDRVSASKGQFEMRSPKVIAKSEEKKNKVA